MFINGKSKERKAFRKWKTRRKSEMGDSEKVAKLAVPQSSELALLASQSMLNYDIDEESSATLKSFFDKILSNVNPDFPPGLAGDICKDLAFFEKRFLVPTRPVAALAVIARLSAHRKLLGGTKVSFLALVSAESAMGKEAQIEYQKLMLHAVGLMDSIVGEPRSDKQMMECLAEYEHLIYILDEVHGMFDKAGSKSSSAHEKAMLNMLLTLSTTAMYQFPPRIKKDLIGKAEADLAEISNKLAADQDAGILEQKTRILDYLKNGWRDPFLAFVGYSTPGKLDSLINKDNIQSGLIGRFLFVRVFQRDKLNLATYSAGPAPELTQRCDALIKLTSEIQITDEAKQLLSHIISYYELNEHRNHPQLGAIYARGVEHVKRIASLLAMETSMITSEMLIYAMRVFQVNIDSCTEVINGASNTEDEEMTRLQNSVIKKLSTGSMKAGTLANALVKCSALIREKRNQEQGYEYRFLQDLVDRKIICFSAADKTYSLT